MRRAILVLLLVMIGGHSHAAAKWTRQSLPGPYEGKHTGVAIHDLNNDGTLDLLFGAGRHGADQSFALINLGVHTNDTFRFSDAIPIGDPGGYYQIDAASLSSLEDGHVGVLLAGGSCTEERYCTPGTKEPAVLLDVHVTGCSLNEPDVPCNSTSSVIWQDAAPVGDRNGAFAPTLGDGIDPAFVLAGNGCVSIFEPQNGTYSNPPSFVLLPEDKIPDDVNNTIKRSAGLATGYVGNLPGLVVGLRTRWAPSPLVAVYRTESGDYDWFDFASNNDTYAEINVTLSAGNNDSSSYADESINGTFLLPIETTGVAMGDINGDGNVDVVESRHVRYSPIEYDYPIPQLYYLLGSDPSQDVDIPAYNMFDSRGSGRSVTMGHIYDDSPLPDIVYGMSDGTIRLFANLGVGFELRDAFRVYLGYCQIRDVEIASLSDCTVSIIAAVDCRGVGNFVFTRPTCPMPSMAPSVSPSPTLQPSLCDDSSPSVSNDVPDCNTTGTGINVDLWPPRE